MPTVFVVNETLRRNDAGELERAQDLTPALSFGQLIHLLPAGQVPADPGVMVEAIDRGLTNFTADDFLLLIGNPAAIGVAVALAYRRTHVVKVLRWVPRNRQYQALVLSLPPLTKLDDGSSRVLLST